MTKIGGRSHAPKSVDVPRMSRSSEKEILDQCRDHQRNDDGTCQVHPAHAPYPIIVHHDVPLLVCQQLDFWSSDRLIGLISAKALTWPLSVQKDIVGLGCAALHSGRADGHAGNSETTT